MGLDMYLSAQKMIFPRRNEKECTAITAMFPDIKPCAESPYIEVAFEIGYWRKANHIHKWFVDNVQCGQDDQEKHYISDDKLNELSALCKKVLENHDLAEELLPTTSGFFFGNTDYEDYYFGCIETTIKIIECALALDDKYSLKYQASW